MKNKRGKLLFFFQLLIPYHHPPHQGQRTAGKVLNGFPGCPQNCRLQDLFGYASTKGPNVELHAAQLI